MIEKRRDDLASPFASGYSVIDPDIPEKVADLAKIENDKVGVIWLGK